MEQINSIIDRADYELGRAHYPVKKLSLLYALVPAGAAALTTGLGIWLDSLIAGTGGLSGIGLRSVLQTIQAALQYIVSILTPFWFMGFCGAALHIARSRRAEPESLLSGFRRFGPVFRLFLLLILLGVAIGIVATYVGLTLYTLSPWGGELTEKMTELATTMQASGEETISEEALNTISELMQPATVVIAITAVLLAIPMIYRYRMALFAVLDGSRARQALAVSRKMVRGRKMLLFRIDLHFWWYYVLSGALIALCYTDVLLDYAGISLPIGDTALSLIFYALYLIGQFLLLWQVFPRLLTSYAVFYLDSRAAIENPDGTDTVTVEG